MNNFITNQKMTIMSENAERQLFSKQDIAAILTIDEEDGQIKEYGDQPIDIIAVWDGHGPNLVIDIIREQNLEKHFATLNPAESLQRTIDYEINKKKEESNIKNKNDINYFKENKNKITDKIIYLSGSTFSFAKIYRNTYTNKIKIVAEWMGDSPILIFVNDKLIFKSENHEPSNERELQRLQEKGISYVVKKSMNGFIVTDEETIEKKQGKYIIFNNKDNDVSFAMTRSLGHNRITSIDTQKKIIECSTNDEIKIIIFSDGVGDILNMDIDLEKMKTYSAEEIVEFAKNRWRQPWYYNNKKITFPNNGIDDCCCAVWWQKKI
jgi:serine/threonine protein phosphatase PrpC